MTFRGEGLVSVTTDRRGGFRTAVGLLLVAVLPTLALWPLYTAPVPISPHSAVEVAGYFQAQALLADGLDSYTYLTPAESMSALHLHSLLSVPLLAAGVVQAGRVVSLLAAVLATGLLVYLGRELVSPRVGVLAGALLWVHPLFIRFASRWWSQSLSIALTTGVVALAVLAVRRESRLWMGATCTCLALAITNHLWEATVALPVVLFWMWNRRLGAALLASLTTLVSVLAVEWVVGLQPAEGKLIETYSVVANPDALFSIGWLVRGDPTPWAWLPTVLAWTLPAALLACLGITAWFIHTWDDRALLLAGWLASGVALVALIPRGWLIHQYYGWPLLAPLALTAAWMFVVGIESVEAASGWPNAGEVLSTVLVLVVLLAASHYAVTGERAGTPSEGIDGQAGVSASVTELRAAGEAIREAGVDSSTAITFVGEWQAGEKTSYAAAQAMTTVLTYAQVPVRERALRESDPDGPTIVASRSAATDCRVMVVATESGVRVEKC